MLPLALCSIMRRPALALVFLGLVLSAPAMALTAPGSGPAPRPIPPKINGVITLDWEDLLPEKERFSFDADNAPVQGLSR